MYKIFVFLFIFTKIIFAKEYVSQIKPFETYTTKSQVSGIIEFVNKNLESTYVKEKTSLIRINSTDEKIELTKQKILKAVQKKIIDIKKQHYEAKKNISNLNQYDKSSEKLLYLETKKELYKIELLIKKLKNEINKKNFNIKNRYVGTIFAKEGEYINIGETLFQSYDISKLKLVLFLTEEDSRNLLDKSLYINDVKSNYRLYKLFKIKDTKRISRYKAIFIQNNKNKDNYFFGKVIKVTLK